MSLCVLVQQNGDIHTSSQTEVDCTNYILQSATEYHSQVGFFYGVTMSDVTEVSWMVFAVLAVAWGFKMLRKQF